MFSPGLSACAFRPAETGRESLERNTLMILCMSPFLKRLIADCRGVSALEYAVFAVGILALIGAGVATLSGDIQNFYGVVSSTFLGLIAANT